MKLDQWFHILGALMQEFVQLEHEGKLLEIPYQEDWASIKELVSFFEPFKQATLHTDSEIVQTISYGIP